MISKRILLYITSTLFLLANMYANQYVYPVAELHDGKRLLVMYQRSLDSVELWIWNQNTNNAIKGLLSFFVPSNVRVLPENNGFSFIDQGTIRVKYFERRSPKAIKIFQPIRSISSMEWIDSEHFYFSGQDFSGFHIYQADMQGNVDRLTTGTYYEFLYPCKVQNNLFCIARNAAQEHIVIRMPWELKAFDDKKTGMHFQALLTFKEPLCYLYMLNETQGFVLSYPGFHFIQDDTYKFTCYAIQKVQDRWEKEKLFNFKIPVEYITGLSESRAYESLEPFLPNYTCKDFVYYTDYEQKRLTLKRFHIPTGTKEIVQDAQAIRSEKIQLFTPIIMNNKAICGCVLPFYRSKSFVNYSLESGYTEFELPTLDLD